MKEFLVRLICCFIPIRPWRQRLRQKLLRWARFITNLKSQHEYCLKCMGMPSMCKMVGHYNRFVGADGEYFPNYLYPRSWNEWVVHINNRYYERSPLLWIIRNKYLAKDYVREKAGKQYVVKLLGVWNSLNDFDFDSMPNRFVLKWVLGSEGKQVIVVKDKSKTSKAELVEKMQESLRKIGFLTHRLHKNRLIAEEYLVHADGSRVSDYKFFASMGNVFMARVGTNEGEVIAADFKKLSYYTVPDWKFIPARHGICETPMLHPNDANVARPKNLDAMLELTKKLSADLPLARIDLYDVDGRILVGEITMNPSGGVSRISPAQYDFEFGKNIKFPSDQRIIDEWIARDMAKYGEARDIM